MNLFFKICFVRDLSRGVTRWAEPLQKNIRGQKKFVFRICFVRELVCATTRKEAF